MVENLAKIYGRDIRAVDDISFSVEDSEIFGLLGPNGAGKTTAIKIITTLIKETSGSVRVFGLETSRRSQEIRQMVGYVPQAVSVDGDLTAFENLLIFSKLFYVRKRERDERIASALEYMGLSNRANDLVKHFSGGMMRRLELAQSLVNRPRILVLDEPSIGLDPTSKRQIWEHIKKLNSEFYTTVLITTHDMSEADELCHRIAIMSSGKISTIGDPKELKRSVGGDILTILLSKTISNQAMPSFLQAGSPVLGIGSIVSNDGTTIKILTENGERAIPRLMDYFERAKIGIDSVSLSKPTLDDVFVKYAKTSLREAGAYREVRSTRRAFARGAR